MTNCRNCETVFEGKFCYQCGQKALVKRITMRSVFQELIKKITIWDKGLLYTTIEILRSPGMMARRYMEGRRVNFTKPLNYILIVVTASVVVFPKKDMEQAMSGYQTGRQVSPLQSVDWIFSNIGFIYLMMIPFLSMVSRWFNRRSDFNYAEQFVFYCYLMAACTLVTIPFVLIANALHLSTIALSPVTVLEYSAWVLFFAWGYVQFFNKQRSYWGGIQAVLVLLISYVLYILAFSLAFGIGIGIAKMLGMDVSMFIPVKTASPTQ
jgi:hypothetical protein